MQKLQTRRCFVVPVSLRVRDTCALCDAENSGRTTGPGGTECPCSCKRHWQHSVCLPRPTHHRRSNDAGRRCAVQRDQPFRFPQARRGSNTDLRAKFDQIQFAKVGFTNHGCADTSTTFVVQHRHRSPGKYTKAQVLCREDRIPIRLFAASAVEGPYPQNSRTALGMRMKTRSCVRQTNEQPGCCL
jgi:hypothetical protein